MKLEYFEFSLCFNCTYIFTKAQPYFNTRVYREGIIGNQPPYLPLEIQTKRHSFPH